MEGQVEKGQEYFCTECKAMVRRADIEYFEECLPLFREFPPLIKFICPKCGQVSILGTC
jgi:hypothetical protein